MCTVTFIPAGNKIFITHNRDEKSSRTKAIPPVKYHINGYTLLFPRDTGAGGSWIGINNTGAAAVLLNGGFIKHQPQPPYRKSRGLVFLDILASGDLFLSFQVIDLTGIEPFTVILWSHHILYECRWDGERKHSSKPATGIPHTWSSATLYTETTIAKRQAWFTHWLQAHPQPSIQEIVRFHLSAGDGDAHNDLRMNRGGEMLTVSVTALEINEDKSVMQYTGLQDKTRTEHPFNFTKAAANQQ